MTKKNLFGYLAVAVVFLLLGYVLAGKRFGQTVVNFPEWFSNGLVVGTNGPPSNEVDQLVSGRFLNVTSFTLGPVGSATSTTSTVQSVTSTAAQKLIVGDSCLLGDASAQTSTAYALLGNITGISSTIPNVSMTVSFVNLNNTTSSVRPTGTIRYTCFHTQF